MKEKETNYAPSYEELEVLEECYNCLVLSRVSDELKKDFRNVIRSLHGKHMDYELRDFKYPEGYKIKRTIKFK